MDNDVGFTMDIGGWIMMLGFSNPNVMQLVFWLVVYLPTPLKNMVYNGLQWLMVVNGWLMDG